ncbi:TLC domain-containing protein 2 isoform X1 [Crotalus tigris]|uniref:TLC domain-containing protein 2 isoform X1 n=1 Tax=Crotalus tigris TaxID=88082 RepID=UPI00192FB64C|nr:TLC domain-containing protein 2 isoform X1 [Crotalus tigris]
MRCEPRRSPRLSSVPPPAPVSPDSSRSEGRPRIPPARPCPPCGRRGGCQAAVRYPEAGPGFQNGRRSPPRRRRAPGTSRRLESLSRRGGRERREGRRLSEETLSPAGGPSPWRRGDDGANGGRRRGTVCLPSHLRLPPWRLPLSRPALRALGSPPPSGLLRSAAGEGDWRGRRARGSGSPAMDLLLPGGSMGAFRLLNTVLERLVPPPSPAQPVRWKWRNIWTSLAHSLLSGSWALLGFYFYPPMGEDLIDHFSPSAHCLLGISIGDPLLRLCLPGSSLRGFRHGGSAGGDQLRLPAPPEDPADGWLGQHRLLPPHQPGQPWHLLGVSYPDLGLDEPLAGPELGERPSSALCHGHDGHGHHAAHQRCPLLPSATQRSTPVSQEVAVPGQAPGEGRRSRSKADSTHASRRKGFPQLLRRRPPPRLPSDASREQGQPFWRASWKSVMVLFGGRAGSDGLTARCASLCPP